ncbi:hypothetical protein WJX74_003873 [Apatococcus lobatus]|uniref:Glycosyl transferase family 1 domain-containing protein n=1 Tax=Apatococcus lobatus TaxID=904363 RepID=A0AAW1RCU9_9CHLO
MYYGSLCSRAPSLFGAEDPAAELDLISAKLSSAKKASVKLFSARDSSAENAFVAYQKGSLAPTRKLKIAYMLPHHNVTGGMKCLVEHLRLLRTQGHTTIAVHRSDSASRAMPPWTDDTADVDIVLKLHQRLHHVYPAGDIDVVVVGIFHQVAELLVGVSAPVLYWEQGHEWLFGDPVRFQRQHNYQKQDKLFHMVLHLPVALASVSGAVASVLSSEFGRSSLIIPNGVDCNRFFPGPHQAHLPTNLLVASPAESIHQRAHCSVLLVGNPSLPLKGFEVAIAALAAVNQVLPLSITWVCQCRPTTAMIPSLASCGLCISLHINPSQDELPGLYRGHDVFLFTSRYEAWGMPVLEAMASGVAVVATRCLGVQTFAIHGVNALLADPQDVLGLVRCLLVVLTDSVLRFQLQLAGRQTALRFSPTMIVDRLEAVLYSLTAAAGELLLLREPCLPDLQQACSWASQACAKTGSSS